MTLLKSLVVLFTMVLISCCSGKKTAAENSAAETNTDITMHTQKMTADGFTKGLIVTSNIKGDCPISIQVEGREGFYFLDPINIEDPYKKDGEKIWFKFAALRMMNRCVKANPISIIEIQKRAE